MKSQRDLKVVLILDEKEACDLYVSIRAPYMMDAPDQVKKEIETCLGYTPTEAPPDCIIKGLLGNPGDAYERGRRDGRAETLHAAELSDSDQQMQASIALLRTEAPEALSLSEFEAFNFYLQKIEQQSAVH